MAYYNSTTGLTGGTGGQTVGWPAHQINDIGLLLCESAGGEAVTLTTANGFVEAASSPQFTGAGATGTRLTIFWCRATSASMASPVVADPGDHLLTRILLIRGAKTTGNPLEASAGGAKDPATTSISMTGVTSVSPQALILAIATHDIDAAGAAFSAHTNANLLMLTEHFDSGSTQGIGGGIAGWSGTKEVAGATGDTTATVTSSRNAFITYAITPTGNPNLTDSMDRTVVDGWGNGWILQGVASVFDCGGANCTLVLTSNSRSAHIGRIAMLNGSARAKIALSALPIASTIEIQLHARIYQENEATAEYYRAQVVIDTLGAGTIAIQKRVAGGAASDIVAAQAALSGIVAGTEFIIELGVSDTSPTLLRARAYKVADGPGAWQASGGSDSETNLQNPGAAGIRFSNNSATAITVTWDDFVTIAEPARKPPMVVNQPAVMRAATW